MDFLKDLAGDLMSPITESAKSQAISTLNDPQFKATVNQFTRDFLNEHKVIIIFMFGSMFLLGLTGAINIIQNYKINQRRG